MCDDISLTGRDQALIYLDTLCLLTTGSAVAAEHGWRVFLPALQPCEVMECKHEKKVCPLVFPTKWLCMVCATAGAKRRLSLSAEPLQGCLLSRRISPKEVTLSCHSAQAKHDG